METIIAYDLGTGGNKASLYDARGNLLGAQFVPYETTYPQSGWHEQRPDDWWNSVVQSTRRLLEGVAARPESIRGLAISGHSLGCVPLNRQGRLLRESTPIWSDSRAGEQAAAFFEKADRDKWYRTTGNGFPPAHYTVFKILWYRDHEPEMFQQIDRVIGTNDYVNYHLTGRIVTDYSYASGCGAYDLLGWKYSDELLETADLDSGLLPEVVPSTEIIGQLSAEAAGALGLPQGLPVACGGVDNSCMALGARCFRERRIYASLGSSMWIAQSSASPLLDDTNKPYVFAHVVPGMFASALAIFSGGSSLRWVRDQLCGDLVERAMAEGRDTYDLITEAAAQSPPGANKLLFNPSLAGGSSLEPSPDIRGGFIGLDLGHTRNDLLRSTLEGIALNLRIVLDELRRLGEAPGEMVVVGGAGRSPLWRQILADALNVDIVQTNVGQDAGALGAAAVAAVGTGLWDDFDPIDDVHQVQSIARPDPSGTAVYEKLLPAFKLARGNQAALGEALARLEL